MNEYLLLLRAGKPAATKSEAENKADMLAWKVYMGALGEKGQLLGGAPLASGGAVISATDTSSDPANSASEGIVGGYLLIKAGNFEHAAEIAKSCPHVANEGNIEIREITSMPAM